MQNSQLENEYPQGLRNVLITDVIGEITDFAARHTKVDVEYRIFQMEYYDENMPGHLREILDDRYGSIWTENSKDLTEFWKEFDRLSTIIKKPLDEPILPDDYPLYQGRVYLVNGKLREFIDGKNMTVGRWKELRLKDVPIVTEVRRCDINGRHNRLPLPTLEPTVNLTKATHWDNHRRRRPRNSNKIKKVK